jgi:hypothetical protein
MTAVQQWWFGSGKGRIASYADAIASDLPLVWWRMDETSGTVGADSGSLGLPFSILVPDDMAFGADPLWQTGKALACHGTHYNSAQAEFDPAINFIDDDGYTLTALVMYTSLTGGGGTIIGHGQTNGDWANWNVGIDLDGHLSAFMASDNSGANRVFFTSSTFLTPGVIYRIVVRWTKAGGEVAMWINDVKEVIDHWPHEMWESTSPIGVGNFPHTSGDNPGNSPLQGVLDEVTIYNRPLTDARLHAHWTALTGYVPPVDVLGHVLREDGGFCLREDGGYILRE